VIISKIVLKTRELAHYLIGKKKSLDFVKPEFESAREDNEEMRRKILSISIYEWKERGFSKGTLSYLKQNARKDKPFTINKHVRERIENWSKIEV